MINVSQLIVQHLQKIGVDRCFSMVGGHSLFLNHAFSLSEEIKTTYMHNEQAISMAADAYFRTSKKPAVINVTAGPAALNCLNGVYGAFVDAIPMIIISGNPKQKQLIGSVGQGIRQYGDQEFGNIIDVVKPITKFATQLRSGMDFNSAVQNAIYFALSGKPGPVWIDVPMDVQSQIVSENIIGKSIDETTITQLVNKTADVSSDILDFIIDKLSMSSRPLLYLGAQISSSNSQSIIKDIIDLMSIPVVTSWNAHDLIESQNKLFVGRPGLRGERSGNFTAYTSDFILSIGTRLSIRQVGDRRNEFSPNSFKVMVDNDINELYKPHLDIDLPLHSDIQNFLNKLKHKLIERKFNLTKAQIKWAKKAREIHNEYKPKKTDYPNKTEINPYHFLIDFFDYVPCESTIICGNGITVVGSFQCAKIKKNQDLFQNVGCASMGYDIPATIGAALGNDKNIICLTGDGSIQLNLQELIVLKSLERNVKIFVINNNGYDSIRQSQKNVFGDDVELHGVSSACGLSFPSMKKLSKTYGYNYTRFDINNYELFSSDLFFEKGDHIIEVFVSDKQGFEPKVGFVKNPDGTITGDTLIDMSPKLSVNKKNEIIKKLLSKL
jgi:acetolactate synthase I/II/III large subunit